MRIAVTLLYVLHYSRSKETIMTGIRDIRLRGGKKNAHLADPELSLTKIGDQFGLSESYLSRLIRKTFDIQLMTYVNAKRTERVAELLEHTSKTLNEIAAVAGFSSYRTMIRVFEQYHMMTPSQYRREKRAERKGHTQEGVGPD